MKSKIDEKIARCLQALTTTDPNRLFSNMKVIEGYIERKPIFLEWLHPEIKILSDGVPTNFSGLLQGQHVDTVRLWFLALRALWGNIRLQGSRFLDLQSFDNVHFTPAFSEAFELEWLRLPKTVHSFIPSADVCWISANQAVSVDQGRWQNSSWALSLNHNHDLASVETTVPLGMVSNRAEQVIGLDGRKASEKQFVQWCKALTQAPIQWLSLPSGFASWGDLPDWSDTLDIVQATGCPSICEDAGSAWIEAHHGLKQILLRNSNISSLPDTVATLDKLEQLDCSGNPLTSLPDWLSDLSCLKILNVAGTPLKKYPSVIEQIIHLEQLVIRNHNAQQTRQWLKRLEHSTNLNVRRLIDTESPDLWTVCLHQYLLNNPEGHFAL